MSHQPGTAALTEALAVPRRRTDWTPYVLLLPSLVFLAFFFVVPMVQALGLALQGPDGAYTTAAFERMTGDAQFRTALLVTLLLIVLLLPLQFVLALAMALVVNARLRGSSLWLYIFALPLAISELAAAIIWYGIFTENGYLNTVLVGLGIREHPFIFLDPRQPLWTVVAIVLAELWRATSIMMVILVAGLQSVSRELVEAADVFGAGPWQKLRRVILPLLRPSLQVALILRTILAFQAFAVVIAIAGRGLTVLAAEAYRWYGAYRDPHVAAAYAVLILGLSIASTVAYLRLLPVRQGMYA
ncbi:MAG TPA: sugar ABC transporter permease [Candidatus Limnocylindrales bacterium]|nr:sugar ABC transporter permease [Candidatus Limnocylindrales bacterium]